MARRLPSLSSAAFASNAPPRKASIAGSWDGYRSAWRRRRASGPGRSSASSSLTAIGQGWADERLLACCPTLPDSEPRSEWLYPEEVDALARVLLADRTIDPYERFLYEVPLDTGARCEELCALRRSHADRRAGVLRIRGKGRGIGKDRTIRSPTPSLTAGTPSRSDTASAPTGGYCSRARHACNGPRNSHGRTAGRRLKQTLDYHWPGEHTPAHA